jgi:hypothetical protein
MQVGGMLSISRFLFTTSDNPAFFDRGLCGLALEHFNFPPKTREYVVYNIKIILCWVLIHRVLYGMSLSDIIIFEEIENIFGNCSKYYYSIHITVPLTPYILQYH